jgi:type I restriction enzyme, R subunit
MNEAETRAELIDPVLHAKGWGVVEGTKVHREHSITAGRIKAGNAKRKPLIADYVLSYKNRKLAAIEAKSDELDVSEGVGQAKNYADKLNLRYTYAANGKEIYRIDMETSEEGLIDVFPTPDELWTMVFPNECKWEDKFDQVPFEDIGGTKPLRFYQEIAVNNVLNAVANDKNRILLTLATGTGKTFIAFQIAWKLFHSRWNLKKDGSRQPRILFLADRNILADQAFNNFNAFPEDALVRIEPSEISKQGRVPTNGSLFFTIFQTFMSGKDDTPHFGQYPADYFDFIIVDECHRGGANDESNWRGILDYFSPAVQLGMTATPKRRDNVDTYRYFGEPVYVYSLKDGINDGFLTPFKVKRVQTTLDEYVYTPDDEVVEGEVEEGRLYTEPEFNKDIEIIARERNRVKILLGQINQKEKTIIFCANQAHAAVIRDLVNQNKESNDPNYCQRVTANDGELGEQHLRDFQDNDKMSPIILTTSQKLSTGVDARNIRNIVLLRPINTMIEFKQIVGRGTRLFEGKTFFTIYDFVNAYHHFFDPEWDGEPEEPTEYDPTKPEKMYPIEEKSGLEYEAKSSERPIKIKIKLRDGKERQIQHMIGTSFWSEDGTPISCEQFLEKLYGKLPDFFKDEAELRKIWSVPSTRKTFLNQMEEAGYGKNELAELQKLIDAERSDLFDVLEYVSFAIQPISREERVAHSEATIFKDIDAKQKEFIDFVLAKYIESGVEELDQDKLPSLLELKYQSIADAETALGDVSAIKNVFIDFQQYLYAQ